MPRSMRRAQGRLPRRPSPTRCRSPRTLRRRSRCLAAALGLLCSATREGAGPRGLFCVAETVSRLQGGTWRARAAAGWRSPRCLPCRLCAAEAMREAFELAVPHGRPTAAAERLCARRCLAERPDGLSLTLGPRRMRARENAAYAPCPAPRSARHRCDSSRRNR